MTTLEFTPFGKIPRLNRLITISEKLDGTNAAVVIVPFLGQDVAPLPHNGGLAAICYVGDVEAKPVPDTDGIYPAHVVYAQSRTRFITPEQDNYGFAMWVQANAEALVRTLGSGTHFGEWWGSKIQRGYGLTGNDKRFSLFNTARWSGILSHDEDRTYIPGLRMVPVLRRGLFDQSEIEEAIQHLRDYGSIAAPGFMNPEGIVIWHEAARQLFKVTLVGDEAPKGAAAHRFDEEIAA